MNVFGPNVCTFSINVSICCIMINLMILIVQFEGDFGEIVALGAKILPNIGLREKWESP